MAHIVEAIGTAAEGALAARAVQPEAGTGQSDGWAGHTHEGACLNCGTVLVGPHCHGCGQRAHVHRTLAAFLHDLLHGVFHFEGKVWRTLPLLAWHPGRLTREYVAGRRASYVSPIALFLFVTFLMFAAFHALGGGVNLGNTVKLDGQKVSTAQAEKQLNARIAALEKQRATAVADKQPVEAIDSELEGQRKALALTETLGRNDWTGFARNVAPPGASLAVPAGPSNWVDAGWRKAKANPELLLFELQADAYKYSWLLIVISVPFVWLLFAWRRRYNLYDHTVFVTYSLSFMMLALTIAGIGAVLGLDFLIVVPLLYAPVHLYRQLRGAYAVSRGGALVRTGLLLVFAAVALVLWALALVGMLLGG